MVSATQKIPLLSQLHTSLLLPRLYLFLHSFNDPIFSRDTTSHSPLSTPLLPLSLSLSFYIIMTIRKRNIVSTSYALTLISCLSLAAAQAPLGVRRMGYTQLGDKLFIQGGFETSYSTQFFSLDLSTSWSDASPAWTKLRDGQLTTHLALTTISGGGKDSILAISGTDAPVFFSAYDIEANTWANISGVARNPYKELEGHTAVTDPTSGLVYIVGGFMSGTTTYNSLSVYNPGTKSLASQQAAASLATSLIDAGAVWSTKRNTMLTFGGSLANPNNPAAVSPAVVNEYDPNSKSWSVMVRITAENERSWGKN